MESRESNRTLGQTRDANPTGEGKREHSKQIDVRSAVLSMDELPPFEATETDPLRVFARRVLPRLKIVLTTYGDSGEEPEEVFQQAILTLSAERRDLDSQDTWTAGTLHLKSMLYWRKRQRGVCDAVDRAIFEMLSDSSAPKVLKRGLKEQLGSWIQALPPRCRNRLKLRYGLAADSDRISLKLESRRVSVRKTTSRCLQGLALEILRQTLA